MTKLRIGIFGGSFNPPHIGHLVLASEAYDQLHLDKVLWMVTGNPPHKPLDGMLDGESRSKMVELSIRGNCKFELSRIEMDRPGPHFAYETVRLVRAEYPGSELTYLIGEDSLRDLPKWKHPNLLIAEVDHLGVMSRENVETDLTELESVIPGIKSKVCYINTPEIHISSTEIRTRIAGGREYRYFLHPAVYQSIRRGKYYKNG
ncbi:MAG TPA: nicotinate-nucleotide adenylyltransferase [Bellilinea sp.]|nr:nicotinate-nucleotide adenylyltransferase [Bellilinea sp.]